MVWVIEALSKETESNELPRLSLRRHPLTLPPDVANASAFEGYLAKFCAIITK